MSKELRFSSVRFFIFFIFFIFVALYRSILPFGDEPDFDFRTSEIYSNQDSNGFVVPFLGGLLEKIDHSNVLCHVDINPLQLHGSIESICIQELDQVVYRSILLLVLMVPVFIVLVNARGNEENINRKNATVLSFLMPSFIYYSGLISNEQVFVIFASLSYLYANNKIILLLLLSLLMLIDVGNGLVICGFYIWYYASNYLYKSIGFRAVILLLLFTFMFLYFGFGVVDLLMNYSAGNIPRVESIYASYQLKEDVDKYPNILRPVITAMSLVFYSADNIKSTVSYLLFYVNILIGFFVFFRYRSNFSKLNEKIVFDLIAAALYVCSVVFILPTYANAKYFVFMLPYIMAFLILIYGCLGAFKRVVLVLVASYFELFLYYM